MIQVLIFLALLGRGVECKVCSKSSHLKYYVNSMKDKDTGQIVKSTVITLPHISTKETVCFTSSIRGETESNESSWAISLNNVKTRFNYINTYEFSIPKIEAKCICDCPGIEDFCSTSTDLCKGEGEECFNWYKDKQSTQGCTPFGIPMPGSSEVCCGFSIAPMSNTKYRAIEVDAGFNMATLTVDTFKEKAAASYELDLAAGDTIQTPQYEVSLTNPNTHSPIKSGWYFGKAKLKELLGGVNINGLHSFDLMKLGWYKYDRDVQEYKLDSTKAHNAFNSEVINCDSDTLKVQLAAKYFAQGAATEKGVLADAMRLEDYYKSSISRLERDDVNRTVEAEFLHYGLSEITVIIPGDNQIMQLYDQSDFVDFRGSIHLDKHGNNYVNITVMGGNGTIRGYIELEPNKKQDSFQFFIPVYEERHIVLVRVFGKCDTDDTANLCLYGDEGVSGSLCHIVKCNLEKMDDFELPNDTINYDKGEKESILSPQFWLKHINPMEWFNGVTTWKEAVVMVTELAGVVTILGVVFRILKICGCLGSCWNWLWCYKDGKDEKAGKKVRRVSTFSGFRKRLSTGVLMNFAAIQSYSNIFNDAMKNKTNDADLIHVRDRNQIELEEGNPHQRCDSCENELGDDGDEKRVSWRNTIEKHYKEGHCGTIDRQFDSPIPLHKDVRTMLDRSDSKEGLLESEETELDGILDRNSLPPPPPPIDDLHSQQLEMFR